MKYGFIENIFSRYELFISHQIQQDIVFCKRRVARGYTGYSSVVTYICRECRVCSKNKATKCLEIIIYWQFVVKKLIILIWGLYCVTLMKVSYCKDERLSLHSLLTKTMVSQLKISSNSIFVGRQIQDLQDFWCRMPFRAKNSPWPFNKRPSTVQWLSVNSKALSDLMCLINFCENEWQHIHVKL